MAPRITVIQDGIKECGSACLWYYEGYKYEYAIRQIYAADKFGQINIIKKDDETAITLITCKEDDESKQLVYIGYLITKKAY